MGIVDLHVHSTASDGVLQPEEIVEWAIKRGLSGVSITDHDTVSGIERAIETAKKFEDFIVVPGIELSSEIENTEVHILGYFIDYKSRKIKELIKKLTTHRLNRGKKMVENLRKLGINITLEEVKGLAGNGIIGRPHIARVLKNKGYVNNMDQAFEKFIGKDSTAYVKRYKLSIREAVDLIHDIGGVSVLAHPGMVENDNIVKLVINEGIDGIEIIHPKHNKNDRIKYKEIAKEYKLIETGGSDFHGCINSDQNAIENCGIDSNVVSKLRNKSLEFYRSEIYGSKKR